jgi:hypothetical protein
VKEAMEIYFPRRTFPYSPFLTPFRRKDERKTGSESQDVHPIENCPCTERETISGSRFASVKGGDLYPPLLDFSE